jgi:hypothetical protein
MQRFNEQEYWKNGSSLLFKNKYNFNEDMNVVLCSPDTITNQCIDCHRWIADMNNRDKKLNTYHSNDSSFGQIKNPDDTCIKKNFKYFIKLNTITNAINISKEDIDYYANT